jgi:hypothetical protein
MRQIFRPHCSRGAANASRSSNGRGRTITGPRGHSVTYGRISSPRVSGTFCHLCLGPLIRVSGHLGPLVAIPPRGARSARFQVLRALNAFVLGEIPRTVADRNEIKVHDIVAPFRGTYGLAILAPPLIDPMSGVR